MDLTPCVRTKSNAWHLRNQLWNSGYHREDSLYQFNIYRSLNSNPQHEASFTEIYRAMIVCI